jgi:hypothetical protein
MEAAAPNPDGATLPAITADRDLHDADPPAPFHLSFLPTAQSQEERAWFDRASHMN